MSVLYIETDTILQKDKEWAWYTTNKGKVEVWKDYILNYEYLTLIAPYKKELCTKNQKGLIKLGNKQALERKNITLEFVEDIYENNFNKQLKEYIKYILAREIRSNEYELIVIGQNNNFYQKQAIKCAKKYNKEYILEGI